MSSEPQKVESARAGEGERSGDSIRETDRKLSGDRTENEELVHAPYEPMADYARAFAQIAELLGHVVPGGVPRPTKNEKPALERPATQGTCNFTGFKEGDPLKAEDWLKETEKVLEEIHCDDDGKLQCMVSLLQGDAYRWWISVVGMTPPRKVDWKFFKRKFRERYVGRVYLNERRWEFMHLKQKEKSILEYTAEFVRLSKYNPESIPNNEEWCRKFWKGLNPEIKRGTISLRNRRF